jgi:hypothetical protein
MEDMERENLEKNNVDADPHEHPENSKPKYR